ncbi:MAG: hypothetical protein K0S32_3433 [Bacteroidetes bacterium]|jgi:hypothetical protein|nr:hypothetical protein [Bacteroidota bacterium]
MITERKIVIGSSEIWIDEHGFVILHVKDDADIGLEEVTSYFEAYTRLGFGPHNKALQLVEAPERALMSPEARKYVSANKHHFFRASAVITKSLPIRLTVNFFNAFYKNSVPLKMFETEATAREWLNTFK